MLLSRTMTFRQGLSQRRLIRCPWSSSLYLLEVLLTVELSSHVFKGVLAEIVDEVGYPLPPPVLLWVLETGTSLELWYDIHQRPQLGDPAFNRIKNVIGHCEDAYGATHYAVQWDGYLCPGWIVDEDFPCNTLIRDYWHRQKQRA